MALEQAVEAAEALSRTLPPKLRARPVSGPTPTTLEDEAAFPQGGFASVSNVGSLENLVTSELVYMEDEPDLDLFDVRYVEGELLYYTRDESVAVRRRRVITFVLLPGLADARVKDAGLRWQRAVVALGLVLCLVRRLSKWLGHEDLRFRVVFPQDGTGTAPLEAERGLCELLLREWRARARPRSSPHPTWTACSPRPPRTRSGHGWMCSSSTRSARARTTRRRPMRGWACTCWT
ncbi:hypothetical protein ACLESO_19440 [Pyxidicoccus sp. 3LG]